MIKIFGWLPVIGTFTFSLRIAGAREAGLEIDASGEPGKERYRAFDAKRPSNQGRPFVLGHAGGED
jgi:hypothetical protein